MKVTTREVKFRDPNGRMVSSLVIGNGSLHDEVADYLDNNPEPVATATGEWLTENITQPTTPVVDTSLKISGAAADSKTVGDELDELKSEISSKTGLSEDFKVALDAFMTAMLSLADNVAYDDNINGDVIYTQIETAKNDVHSAMYPPASLTRITADYRQSGDVYDTATLNSLKSDLVVIAIYDSGTRETVTNYALSGTLTEGTSTITVSYGGKTTTFNVIVSASPLEPVAGAYAIWDARDYTVGQTWSDRIGSIALTPTGSPVKANGAVQFDGTAKYFSFGSLSVPTASGVVCIQASFKLTDLTKTSFIVCDDVAENAKINIALRPQDGVIRIQFFGGNRAQTINYSYTFDSDWHFLTAKLGEGTKIVYVDNTMIESKTDSTNTSIAQMLNSATALKSGAYTVYNGYSNMYLRSLYIYTKSLSDADIANNYSVESTLWG